MKSVALISSAAYIEPELEAEFGRLPPAFLPLGNRRLFVHQHAVLKDVADRLLLSLPEDFEPDAEDLRALANLDIEIVSVPNGLTLGQSLVYVVNVTATAGAPFTVMHGDTLLTGLPSGGNDLITVSQDAPPGYPWGYVREGEGGLEAPESEDAPGAVALTGYFAFADASLLVQSVTRAKGSFVQGLLGYARTRPLQLASAERWLDFGHASTFHLSRQAVTTEREFNRLVAGRRSINKSGDNPRKIEAEARWFETLPPPLRLFTPAYLGMSEIEGLRSYDIEYMHLPTLSDLLVFGRLSGRAWERIMDACDEFLAAASTVPLPEDAAQDADGAGLYLDKTMTRLARFADQSGIDPSAPARLNGRTLPSLETMAHRAASAIAPAGSAEIGLIHGDFCFSNIFYDFRAQQVKVIDPRGLSAGDRLSSFGDRRYDVAKLHHSVIGLYDFIVAGACSLERLGPLDFAFTPPENASIRAAQGAFRERRFLGARTNDLATDPISVLLFLSMLPLHSDRPDRQFALLANAMRLFQTLDTAEAS